MLSLRTTLLAAIAYVLVLAIVVLEVPLVLNLSRRVDAEVKAEAAGQAQIIAATASERIEGPPRPLQNLVETAASQLGGRVILLGADGRVIVDSAGVGLRGASYADRPEVVTALGGETAQGERHSDSLGEDLLFTAVPVFSGGATVGVVRVTQSVTAVNDEVRRDALGLVGVGLAALLLGLAVAWVLAGFLARPPRALAETARRVAAGDLDARATEQGPREQREVARAFNEMTARLSSALAAQREFVGNASHQLRTPLTGLRLRLEAAADQTSDPVVAAELAAAEDEVIRLSRLIDNLLTLAGEGQSRPEPEAVDLSAVARAAAVRWEAEAGERGGELALDGVGRRGRAGVRRRPRDRARQPDRERARLRRPRPAGDDRLAPRRRRSADRGRRSRPRARAGRGTNRAGALRPRQRRRPHAGHRARPRDRRFARPPLGRHPADAKSRRRRARGRRRATGGLASRSPALDRLLTRGGLG